jgi:hypothetical protein
MTSKVSSLLLQHIHSSDRYILCPPALKQDKTRNQTDHLGIDIYILCRTRSTTRISDRCHRLGGKAQAMEDNTVEDGQ